MDDEDEVRDLNLSSRPLREERRRARERERLERGMARSQSMPSENSNEAHSVTPRGSPSPNPNRGSAMRATDEHNSLRRDIDTRYVGDIKPPRRPGL